MAFIKSTFFFMALLICSSYAYTIEVGGGKGDWSLTPRENYNVWASRMRFSVNDTLHFKYNNNTDSVLVVSQDDYDKCNPNNPIIKLDATGDSSYTFDKSGPFYFITGNKANCDQGQKFHLVVLTVRSNQSSSASVEISPSVRPEAMAASAVSFVFVMISLGLFAFLNSS